MEGFMLKKQVFVRDVSRELGRLLRARRWEIRSSLDDVAMRARVPYSQVIGAEHGKIDISFARLRALCIALGLEITFQTCEPQVRVGDWLHPKTHPVERMTYFTTNKEEEPA
jgi:transcriptional regulator with XRE-family HTH domain